MRTTLAILGALVATAGTASAGPLYAVVTQQGTLTAGNGVTGVTYFGAARYEVTFDRDVSDCAYVATTPNTYSQAIMVFTAGGHLGSHGVYVETKNQGGGLTDGPFHLVVACDEPRTARAVVGYAGELVRATPGTSLASLGTGRFGVHFDGPVAGCAFLATVGDPGNVLVFSPSGVYPGTGPDANTVYIETKNPGGGLQDGVPFHLAVVCPDAGGAHVAVVHADGLPRRGSRLTSSLRSATGRYAVVTNVPIASCATVVTRGSVSRDAPGDPATVELVAGPAPNAAGIDVRAILAAGGTAADASFHAAIICDDAHGARPEPAELRSR